MKSQSVTVLTRAGVHARPASIIVQIAQEYECDIWIEKENVKINAKSIMNLLTLDAQYKTELTISVDGSDEDEALERITALFNNKFKEQ